MYIFPHYCLAGVKCSAEKTLRQLMIRPTPCMVKVGIQNSKIVSALTEERKLKLTGVERISLAEIGWRRVCETGSRRTVCEWMEEATRVEGGRAWLLTW